MTTREIKLSVCIAAYLFHQQVDNTATTCPPAAKKRAAKLLSTVEKWIGCVSATTIPLKIRLLHDNNVLNIVKNMQKYEDARRLISSICDAGSLLTKLLNIKTLVTHDIFEFNRSTKCIIESCQGHLKNTWKSFTNTRGSICLTVSDIHGPSLAVSHQKQCKKCKAVYSHDTIRAHDGSVYLLPVQEQTYYQNNTTFYHVNTFAAAGNGLFEEGIHFEYFAKTWNRRFAKRRGQIVNALDQLDQHIGHHKRSDPCLVAEDLSAAFYNYMLIKTAYHYLLRGSELLHITAEQLESYKILKLLRTTLTKKTSQVSQRKPIPSALLGKVLFQGKVHWSSFQMIGIALHQPVGHHNGTLYGVSYFDANDKCGLFLPKSFVAVKNQDGSYTDICSRLRQLRKYVSWTSDDQFNALWQIYGEQVNRLPSSALRMVPVRYGMPHHGHSITYGDGSAKSSLLCKTPHPIFARWNAKELESLSTLHCTQREFNQCPQRPYSGNQHQLALDVCGSCAVRFITETSLYPEALNAFVDFFQSKLKLAKLQSKVKLGSSSWRSKIKCLSSRLRVFQNKFPTTVKDFEALISLLVRPVEAPLPTCMSHCHSTFVLNVPSKLWTVQCSIFCVMRSTMRVQLIL